MRAALVAILFLSVATLPVLGQEAAANAEATEGAAEGAASTDATEGTAEGDATNEAALATLNMEIKQAEEDQMIRNDHAAEVISNFIDGLKPAVLMAGDGDVSTTGEPFSSAPARCQMPVRGLVVLCLCRFDSAEPHVGACAEDIGHFCTVIKPGEGRLYQCLKVQRRNEQLGNNDGAGPVSVARRGPCLRAQTQMFGKGHVHAATYCHNVLLQ